MYLVNIFIALIVSLGFWKISNKERKAKTAKASFTKTFILVILTSAITVFYIKTYQVATFKNYIQIHFYKGSYESIKKTICFDGIVDTVTHWIPYDRVSSLVIFNRLSDNKFNFYDPKRDLYDRRNTSGLEVKLSLDYNHKHQELDSKPIYGAPSNLSEMKFCYDVDLLSNTIPSLFPISVYEENTNNVVYSEVDQTKDFESYSKRINKTNDGDIWGDYDKMFCTRLMSKQEERFYTQRTFSNTLNTLNFFSAADLSQCNYQIIIRSSIPIDNFSVFFDIPIELIPGDVKQTRQDSRDFSIDIEEDEEGSVDTFKHYHINFPTLTNMQLIRSLILTTILTALYSLTFISIYYSFRRLYNKYLFRHSLAYKTRKEMMLLWLPAGKIIVWSFLLLFTFAIILTILNAPFKINYNIIIPVKILFFFVLIIYCILVVLVLYFLHRKNIYVKDLSKKFGGWMNLIKNKNIGSLFGKCKMK